VFQKTLSKYFGWFAVGMGYIVLWQYELDDAFGTRSAWRGLLAIWAVVVGYMAFRGIRQGDTKEREPGTPDFRKP
jgi:hypothetical protein